MQIKRLLSLARAAGYQQLLLSFITQECGTYMRHKVRLKCKVHWLRVWNHVYVACGLELIHTCTTGSV